ncbi:translation initiation factor eIF4e [Exidia glandulosa HHB12029]|uniref:Eukaryotic translation initiation factor 4E n=1 Tax=Exidia glandulosa HHB12029 TaxID=1314781 RepID=A0A165PDG2_EXIGL|nr:translation initiation factor eIF4e [Exidia glandulosa HHB12029]
MSGDASSSSTLPAAALAASRAALSSALADPSSGTPLTIVTATDGDIQAPAQDATPLTGQPQDVDAPMPQFDQVRTVFSDPNNFNVKHPLYSSWTLWFDSPSTKGRNLPQTPATPSAATPFTPATPGGHGGGWMDDIKKVISFDSVEEFWGLYNNIVPPSQLPPKANYYLFKEGIIPAWEDDANKQGGKWSIQFPKDKNRGNIDKMWLYTMLAAIGETFDPALSKDSNEQTLITGVIVSSRPQFYRVSIWTRLAPNYGGSAEDTALKERIESIGKTFKMGVLGYQEGQKLAGALATEVEFASHKDSEKKGRARKLVA